MTFELFCIVCLPRTYELKVHGGTPFESGVELDAAASTKGVGTPCVFDGLLPYT